MLCKYTDLQIACQLIFGPFFFNKEQEAFTFLLDWVLGLVNRSYNFTGRYSIPNKVINSADLTCSKFISCGELNVMLSWPQMGNFPPSQLSGKRQKPLVMLVSILHVGRNSLKRPNLAKYLPTPDREII